MTTRNQRIKIYAMTGGVFAAVWLAWWGLIQVAYLLLCVMRQCRPYEELGIAPPPPTAHIVWLIGQSDIVLAVGTLALIGVAACAGRAEVRQRRWGLALAAAVCLLCMALALMYVALALFAPMFPPLAGE